MTDVRCPRVWEIEARRDGRLGAESMAEAERHWEACSDCARELGRFRALRDALRRDPPKLDDISFARLRQRVRAAADERLRRPTPAPRRAPTALALACASLAALLAVFVAPRLHSTRSLHRSYAVVAQADTRWSDRLLDGVRTLRVERGRIDVLVMHADGDPRVVVEVPDGVIEDEGTRFRVDVREGVTEEIGVFEGRVRFAPRGRAPISIDAGARWTHEVAAMSVLDVVRAPMQPSSAPPPAPGRGRSVSRDASHSPATRGLAAVAGLAVAPADPSVAPEGAQEDACYLQVLALLRDGRRSEARTAARDYLARFPTGLRRVEVAEIAK